MSSPDKLIKLFFARAKLDSACDQLGLNFPNSGTIYSHPGLAELELVNPGRNSPTRVGSPYPNWPPRARVEPPHPNFMPSLPCSGKQAGGWGIGGRTQPGMGVAHNAGIAHCGGERL